VLKEVLKKPHLLQNRLVKTAPLAKPFDQNRTTCKTLWSKPNRFQNQLVKTPSFSKPCSQNRTSIFVVRS
jgi:hypothetical protein